MSRERTAAWAGVLYVAMDVVVGVMAGAPPSPQAPEGEILGYIASHRAGLAAGLWLFGLATIPLLWWFGALWAVMVESGSGAMRLAVTSLAGLLLGGTMSLASAVLMATLGLLPAATDGVVTTYTLAAVFLSAAGFGLATHLVATTIVATRIRLLPRWLVVVGLVSASAFLASAVLGVTTTDATANIVGLVGFVLWLVWILGISYRLNHPAARPWVARETSSAPDHRVRARSR